MSNLQDYLDWRGDLTFAERPFNELDSLVFCQLSYTDMRAAFHVQEAADASADTAPDAAPDAANTANAEPAASVEETLAQPSADAAAVSTASAASPAQSEKAAGSGDEAASAQAAIVLDSMVRSKVSRVSLPLCEVVKKLDEAGKLDVLLADGVEKHDVYAEFVHRAARSRRFRDVLLYDYEDIFDKEEQIQFCAVTFRIDDRTDYIAFRGTDDSIVGWKEDFMIAFEKIPAQDAALEYLKRHIHRHPGHRYYIGGHSKGANLALYAAALLPGKLQAQVLHVDVFDGPGLCPDVLDTSIIQSIDHKTTKIVPEYDIIGKIFEMPITDNRIVRSNETGIQQHGILTWQMKDGDLDLVPENAPGSQWIGRVLDGWIGGVAPADRATFINDLFDTMAAGGTNTFYELWHQGPDVFEKVLAKAANIQPVSWSVATALPLTAAVGADQAQKTQDRFARFTDMLKSSQIARSLILIGGGIVCMLIPSSALPLFVAIVMTIALGTILGYTLHEFWKSHWNLSAIQNQAYISIFGIVVYLVVIIKEGALMLISNLVFGILFLFLAYHILQRTHDLQRWSFPWLGSLFETALLVLMAIYILIAPIGTIRMFTFICGCIFLVDGIIHMIMMIRGKRLG